MLTAHLLGNEGLLCARTALVLQLLHVVGHRIDQVVGELSVAHPGIAQQIEVALIGLQIAKVVDGVEVRQARVVQQVLLRDAELGQQRFGNAMQRFQRGAFFPFAGHLTPAEILGVLLERRQLRQGVIAHQELGHRGPGRIVQYFREQPAQPPAFGGQGFADQLLQGGVAWPNDLVLVEPDDQLGGDEPSRRTISAACCASWGRKLATHGR
ncbi:hypothetical protein ALO53_200170 [Pseudomonas amygdali pv. photiniae]|uniref:Uncharacterized protein n=1 Tax=Pseudomonas amygdali pv. photiniae TaxID=251724 RepID=A0A0P9VMM4_PSEA0|nr:hypothetical protein ALO53_200170 [Pseudomonas amygdali pv. photiniae]